MKITVKQSPIHGLGVFALEDVAAGDTLERCAYIVIDDDDLQEVNRLNDYLFTSPDADTDYLVVMGAHAPQPRLAAKREMGSDTQPPCVLRRP